MSKQTEHVQFVSTLSKGRNFTIQSFDIVQSRTLLRHCCRCGRGLSDTIAFTPLLHPLRWLKAHFIAGRIRFKLAVLAQKRLYTPTDSPRPVYLSLMNSTWRWTLTLVNVYDQPRHRHWLFVVRAFPSLMTGQFRLPPFAFNTVCVGVLIRLSAFRTRLKTLSTLP